MQKKYIYIKWFNCSYLVNEHQKYMCYACRIVCFVICVYNKYLTHTYISNCGFIDEEIARGNEQRGAHPKSRYAKTCVWLSESFNLYGYIILGILVLIVPLSCQIISLTYKDFISLYAHFSLIIFPLPCLL